MTTPLTYSQWWDLASVKTTDRVFAKPPLVRPAFTFPPSGLRQQHVYRLWDAAGRLLYVGWTEHVGVRMFMHRYSSPWWPEVASYQVDTFRTRRAASLAERSGIANEGPLHNVARPGAGWCAPCLIEERPEWTP